MDTSCPVSGQQYPPQGDQHINALRKIPQSGTGRFLSLSHSVLAPQSIHAPGQPDRTIRRHPPTPFSMQARTSDPMSYAAYITIDASAIR
jgi:hypothetical protein